jgi:hypothetical protein
MPRLMIDPVAPSTSPLPLHLIVNNASILANLCQKRRPVLSEIKRRVKYHPHHYNGKKQTVIEDRQCRDYTLPLCSLPGLQYTHQPPQ